MSDHNKQQALGYLVKSLMVLGSILAAPLLAWREELTLPLEPLLQGVGAAFSLLLIWAWWSWNKTKELNRSPEHIKKAYNFDEESGIYTHKKTSARVCPICLEEGKEYRMKKDDNRGKVHTYWSCALSRDEFTEKK